MLISNLNRRGSVPVTIFVIVVLILLITTLASFSISLYKSKANVGEGFLAVQEYNLEFKSRSYSGLGGNEPVRKSEKKYWFFGEERLKVSVSMIP